MGSVFRNETRNALATGLVDQFQQDSASVISNRLYCAIGDTRGTDLSGDVLSEDDFTGGHVPGEEELSFWYDPSNGASGESIIGMQKVDENNISIVVPRTGGARPINWTASTAYLVGDYVIAENGAGVFDVFLCVADGTNSTTQPEWTGTLATDNTYFNDGKDSLITDGSIVWKYLFRIPGSIADFMLDDNWIPVPYNASIATDSGAGEVDDARADAAQILNAYHVMAKIELLADNGGINLPDSGAYSKVALIKNPRLSGGGLVTSTSALAALLSNDGSNPYPSGTMMYLSHRGPITRQPLQTEDIKVVMAL